MSRVEHHHNLMYASNAPYIPVELSLLTKLETLSIGSTLNSRDNVSLAWVKKLTKLQDYSIAFSYVESQIITLVTFD